MRKPGGHAGERAILSGLADELEALFSQGVDAPLSDEAFNALALRVFHHQASTNPTFASFCARRGARPDSIQRWQDVPAVPASAFKAVDLYSGGGAHPEAVFLTSGTTRGTEARGRHPVFRLALYRASALAGLRAHLVPEDDRIPILSLIPSPAQAPSSSLSTMLGFAAGRWGDPVVWLAHPERGVDPEAFVAAAREVEAAGRPALVAGTAFAFVHLVDALQAAGIRLHLPPGTRVLETGGFKGRSREVGRDELYAALERSLGVPSWRIVNEYGMTELLSQLYEPTLSEGSASVGGHVPPPWLRVRALDPVSLQELPAGEVGVLAFFDLANVGSVSHVLTQDMGSVSGGRLHLRGREPGAEPRGCSLALEDVLAAHGVRG